MPSGREIADVLAAALGGSVRELATTDRSEWVTVLADGRVPLLVRDFGHLLGVCLVGVRGWHDRPANFGEAVVQEIVGATRMWAQAEPLSRATMFERAAVLAEFLAAHTGETWTVSFPGVVVPSEVWLHPRENAASASVGVFADAVRVWSDRQSLERVVVVRSELQATSSSMRAIAAAVDGQRADHVRNLELGARIEALAERLIARLQPQLGDCVPSRMGYASYSTTIRMSLWFPAGEVRLVAREGRVVAEAGLVGGLGWSSDDEVVEAMIEPIVEALALERRTLTIERLTVGREYRVLEDLQGLCKGMIVRFDGFDDIDNHYGRYEFTSRDGRRVAVAGDFSTPRSSPLGEAHRYLEAIEG